jgi:hypothetical protein
MPRYLLAGVLLAGLVALGGCPDNKYEVDTWIDKLDDRTEVERAVTEIEHLGNPKAIPALGKTWDKQGKPVRVLQVIIDLATPLTAEEADAKHLTDYAKKGRPSSWHLALPILKQAVTEIDEVNPRSLDSAVKAADALGDAKIDEAKDILIELANQKFGPKAQRVRVSAILALGKYRGDQAAIVALSKMLRASLDEFAQADVEGMTAKDEAEAKGAYERKMDAVKQSAAAINALAEVRSPEATKVLIEALYRVPGLAGQVRRALVASGAAVASEMRKILSGGHAEVNQLFTEKKLGVFCGVKNELPAAQCKPLSTKDFYAALILGDLYDRDSVKDLLAALDRPPQPVYYQEGQPSPNSQHNAIYDALRKIGSPDAAAKTKAVWSDDKLPVVTRALAVGAWGFLTRDHSVEALGASIDKTTDPGLQQEMLTTYARVAASEKDVDRLQVAAARENTNYREAKAKAEGKEKQAYEKAKKALADAKKKFGDAQSAFAKAGGAKKAPAALINAMTAAQKEVDAADEAHDNAKDDWKPLDNARLGYLNLVRGLELHIARIEIAIRCKQDPACYAKTLTTTADEIMKRLDGKYIKTFKEWEEDDKKLLVAAQIERAMLELGKIGNKASAHTGALLDAAKSTDRIIRQSVLLALPKIASIPCKECEAKLDEAIKAGEGKTGMTDLNVETTIIRNYFSWAGGNTPSKPVEAPAEEPPADKPAEPAPSK